MIANADHVPQLQRRKETMNLFAAFLSHESIQELDGIIPMTRAQLLTMERRGEARIRVQNPQSHLQYRHSDLKIATNIVDLNFFGVLLNFENAALAAQAAQFERDMALELQDEEGSFSIECLIFESQGQQLRALFKHGSFEVAERLLRYVERQKAAAQNLEYAC